MAREGGAILAMGALLTLSHLAALLLTAAFPQEELQTVEDPNNPVNVLFYIVLILGFTAFILLLIRKRRGNVLRYVILGVIAFTMFFVFNLLFFVAFAFLPAAVAALLNWTLSLTLAGGLTYGLFRYPEWWVVDAAGLSVAAGVTALVGINFGILPALLFLVALAVYDAIAVYKTKHMVTLADAVSGLRLPILLVIPKRLPYSFRQEAGLQEQLDAGDERAAMFMGLGDIIIPGVLVVSAFANLPGGLLLLGVTGNLLVALATLVGTLAGFALLMRFVLTGRPQAGLPLLNAGAIAGYLLAYALVFRDLTFGIVL